MENNYGSKVNKCVLNPSLKRIIVKMENNYGSKVNKCVLNPSLKRINI